MIIGLTGSYCSGKDSVANIIMEKDFLHISLSDLLRNELKKKGKKITRDVLINFGNKLRKEEGPSVLARVALTSMIANTNYVVSSIRNQFELEVLKSRKDFILVKVDASSKERFERMKKRHERKEDDKIKTIEDFKKMESIENSEDTLKQQINIISDNANIIIKNNKSLKELKKKVNRFLDDYMPKLAKRPPWDEYFMEICKTVGSRATCDRGKAGAVIVKNKRILSTGYVGSPVGLPHCQEVGHEFIQRINEDGTVSKHCIRTSHAEANAIVQAARHGISIDGSTLYCKMAPCYDCAKLIINAGIKRVVAEMDYHGSTNSKRIFKQAGVKLEIMHNIITKYANMK